MAVDRSFMRARFITAKMLLHNRDDLVNFAIIPGSGSNFHGKSGQTFL